MARREGLWDLRFDLTREDHPDTDGHINPDWVKASDSYAIIAGDLSPAGGTDMEDRLGHAVDFIAVAVHTVEEDGTHIGRDWLGRAVKLIPMKEEV